MSIAAVQNKLAHLCIHAVCIMMHVLLYNCKTFNYANFVLYTSGQVLHFCMWNFVFGNTAHRALVPETKFHILVQKYDGLENIETWSRALEVTLVEAPTQVWVIITLKTNWAAFYHKLPGTLIILNTSFSISATQATQNRNQNYSCGIGQDLLIQLY